MVVALRFRDEELDRYRLQERRIRGRYVARRIVVTDFETQLITADRDRTTTDERPVGAAVVVCYSLDNRPAATVVAKLGKRYRHALRRTAVMVVEHMGRQAARNRQFIGGFDPVAEPERGNAKDFVERGFKFSLASILQAPLVLPQDRLLRVAADADDEGNVEFLQVGVAQLRKQCVFGIRKAVEPGAALLRFRFRRDMTGAC